MFPAKSVARTVNVCAPSDKLDTSSGDEHAANDPLSIRHSTDATPDSASDTWNRNDAVAELEGSSGAEEIAMVGARVSTTKAAALDVAPPGVVTEIAPVVAPSGTDTVSDVPASLTEKVVPWVPLNATDVAPVKWFPVIVTGVPGEPLVGLKPTTTGAGMTVKSVLLVAVPRGVVIEIGPLVAEAGTVASTWVPSGSL